MSITSLSGEHHTIATTTTARHNAVAAMANSPAWPFADTISHWVWIDTEEQSSLEIIGCSRGPGDRLSFSKGTLIISEDSHLCNGNRGCCYSQEGTTTILLDGARVGSPDALVSGDRATYGIGGTLMFGTPEHPLTRDLIFSAKRHRIENINPSAKPGQRTEGASFVLGPTARMEVHSADPTTARVIFRPRATNLPVSQYVFPRGLWNLTDKGLTTTKLWQHEDVPAGVTAVFAGETDFDGVIFDGFYEHGIVVDPAARAKWKNVTFGENNRAEPEKLFRPVD